jgi:hypothetical protein
MVTPVSSTNKSDCHNITEILLKVALNTKPLNNIKKNLNQSETAKLLCITGFLFPWSYRARNGEIDQFSLYL